jgi:hypothetical protein
MKKIEMLFKVFQFTNTRPKNMETQKIFRYKLCDAIMANITQFAQKHQFDDRHSYKDAWVLWLAENQDTVEREVARLHQLDYKGDVIDKMFKAGRYYFRAKAGIHTEQKEQQKEQAQQEPKRRDYIVMNQDVIQAMDAHLQSLIKQKDFKPALAYNQFCEEHEALLRKEIGRLGSYYTGEKLSAKFKKTYKNRYFSFQRHL